MDKTVALNAQWLCQGNALVLLFELQAELPTFFMEDYDCQTM